MAERLGNQASNQKVAGSIPSRANDVMSFGKALHPTCLKGECPCTYCKSLWKRASAKRHVNVNVHELTYWFDVVMAQGEGVVMGVVKRVVVVMARVAVRQAVVAGLLAAVSARRRASGRAGLRAARGGAVAYGAATLLPAVAHVSTLRVLGAWRDGMERERRRDA